jgi:hypothetical protein
LRIGVLVALGYRERRQRIFAFAGHAQRLLARCEHRQFRARAEQFLDEARTAATQMFAGVEHEQHRTTAEALRQSLRCGIPCISGTPTAKATADAR